MNRQHIFLSACLLIIFSLCFEPMMRLTTVFSNRDNDAICVVLDPGHGGVDGGAIGTSGTIEKDINLEISKRIFDLLGLFGISAKLTRDEDVSLGEGAGSIRAQKNEDLKTRVELANLMHDSCFLSIHLNSFSNASCHGAQVFYAPISKSNELAKSVQSFLRHGMDKENHRVAKVAERGHYLLHHIQIPAIIIECGFLSNRTEEENLSNSEYQKRLAACIVQGYRNYRK